MELQYYADHKRHLVCRPYSIENLHTMAARLGIHRCWFHRDHYDIPVRRADEILAKCVVVRPRDIVAIIKNVYEEGVIWESY